MIHRNAAIAACLAATASAALLVPRFAAAHDDDRRPVVAFAVSLPPAPPPWVVAVLPPPPLPWRQGPASLSVTYRWLDANRAAYLARWGWNPWRVARYEAWYGGYRAALDARWTNRGHLARAPDRRNDRWSDRRDGRGHGPHDD